MEDKIVSIGEQCLKCGADKWHIVDNEYYYNKICAECYYINSVNKQDYVSKFECPDCGSLSGTLEENDSKLGVRCKNCGKLHIMLEKQTTINNRNKPQVSQVTNQPKCPTCGSTNIEKISVGKKMKGSFLFGVLSSDVRNTMHCKSCGAKW